MYKKTPEISDVFLVMERRHAPMNLLVCRPSFKALGASNLHVFSILRYPGWPGYSSSFLMSRSIISFLARKRRDITVPILVPVLSAASWYESPSQSQSTINSLRSGGSRSSSAWIALFSSLFSSAASGIVSTEYVSVFWFR